MSSAEPPRTTPAAGRVARIAAPLAILGLLGYIGFIAPTLWGETTALLSDWSLAQEKAVVGYIDIHPLPNFAAKPKDWARPEGDDVLLWSGWSPEEQTHRWFRVGRGQLDLARLHEPFGRDVVRAIDRTIVEGKGGTHWSRVPSTATVAPVEVDGVPIAYPWRVLEKVAVVNDEVAERPILVTFTPYRKPGESVHVYDPIHQGRRLTMGVSGHFDGERPLLYDRGTESLWVARDDGVHAVAGRMKGTALPMLARLTPTRWADWSETHPTGRLVVGADRTGAIPLH